ncbi:MAG TPA: CPBP family intramembrane glutamic endopeptidase [Steroidobacteraceae bacterium]|nr:CPBP family intramembrane glutamic endopeptidase [Steroidobacteraceae bacterium]
MRRGAGTLFLAFLLALPAAMLVAALASPWVQWLLAPLAAFPLHRIFSRLTLLAAFGWMIWVMTRSGLARCEVLGYGLPPRAFALRLLAGLAAGLALMAIAVAPLFALGLRDWNLARLASAGGPLVVAVKGLGSGLLVALIEETFFRGAMQGALERRGAPRLALFAVPALYAAVHFLGRAGSVPFDEVTALSGFTALAGFFSGYAEPLRIFDAFVALYCVGLLLALVRRRTGSIATCVGLHAGFVAVIAVFRKISVATPSPDWSFLVSDYDGLLGLWIAALTAACCLVLWLRRA